MWKWKYRYTLPQCHFVHNTHMEWPGMEGQPMVTRSVTRSVLCGNGNIDIRYLSATSFTIPTWNGLGWKDSLW